MCQLRTAVMLGWMLGAAASTAQIRCLDDSVPAALTPPLTTPQAAAEGTPRDRLAALVRSAIERSHAVGAATLLADAALRDIDEAAAAHDLQAGATLGLGPQGERSGRMSEGALLRFSGSIQVSMMMYDGGRTRRLVDWRNELAEAARLGQINTQEQVAASTVALALERSRYRQQAQVYAQQVRKMACLTQALESIVATDRGRASELVQARKSLQTAELAQAQAQSQVRQVEVRLRRMAGTDLPSPEGLATAVLEIPSLPAALADAAQSAQIAQLSAQSAAADNLAQSVELSTRPKLGWTLEGSAADGTGGLKLPPRTAAAGFTVSLNIPLRNPGIDAASDSARKRARAAMMQRDDALEARRQRIAETHEQTTATLDRARRLGTALRDSDQLRNFTLQQWQQLGRRSLFDVMSAEAEHYNLRVQYVNALHDAQQLNALVWSLSRGVWEWLR
jgi:outer membrane protein TolC